MQGFLEASAIYLPCLRVIRNKKAKGKLSSAEGTPVNVTPGRDSGDNDNNVTVPGIKDTGRVDSNGQTDKSSDEISSCTSGEKDDAAKLLEAQRKEVMSFRQLELRKQLCYIDSGNTLSSSGKSFSFWSGMSPTEVWTKMASRLRPLVFCGHPRRSNSVDVHAIEMLLSRSMADMSLLQTGSSGDSKTVNLVVWFLGDCPNQEDLEKIALLMEFQATRPIGNSALLIILAAEPRYDLEDNNGHMKEEAKNNLLKALGHPFDPLIQCYQRAIRKAKQIYRENHHDSLTEIRRLNLIHYQTWPEVMALAFERDAELQRKAAAESINSTNSNNHNSDGHADSLLPSLGWGVQLEGILTSQIQNTGKEKEAALASGSKDGASLSEASSSPSVEALRAVLLEFIPEEVVERILFDSEEIDQISNATSSGKTPTKEEAVEDSASESSESTHREDTDISGAVLNAMAKSVRLAGDFFASAFKATTFTNEQAADDEAAAALQKKRRSSDDNNTNNINDNNIKPRKGGKRKSARGNGNVGQQIQSFKQLRAMKARFDVEMRILLSSKVKKYVSILIDDCASNADKGNMPSKVAIAAQNDEEKSAAETANSASADSSCNIS